MKIYLAVSGEYSDFQVCHAFARREDAESYRLSDDVLEFDVHRGPVEVRPYHTLYWRPALGDRRYRFAATSNPCEAAADRDFDGDERYCAHTWETPETHLVLVVQGWNINRVRKVYSEQRAQHLARQAGIT